jgi:hypothetical protein
LDHRVAGSARSRSGAATRLNGRPKDRGDDDFKSRRPGQEDATAYERDGQPGFSAPLEQKTREIDRIDHVGGLKLVEASPHQSREAGANLEAVGPELGIEIGGAQHCVSRDSVATRGIAVRREGIHIPGEVDQEMLADVLPPLGEETRPHFCDRLAPGCFGDVRNHVEHHRDVTVDLRRCC